MNILPVNRQNNKRSLPFEYTVRRSRRAKKTRITVSQNKIEVVSPFSVSQRSIHEFVWQQQDWIVKAKQKVDDYKSRVKKIAPEQYQDGVQIPYQGRQLRLKLCLADDNKVKIVIQAHELLMTQPLGVIMQSHVIKQALIEWMKNQAAEQTVHYVDKHASRFKLTPGKINIKTQKSRWGSCGIHNDINLNWLLILAPAEVMEYVVVHELCHIRERNHSANFWRLVEIHLPDYKQHRHWLKQHGASLMQGL